MPIPSQPEALAHYGYELFNRRGALAVWEMLRAWPEGDETPPNLELNCSR